MDGLEEFLKALRNRPKQKIVEIEYRVYYDGKKVLHAMSNPKEAEWPDGDSIVISKEEYANFRSPENYAVVDGELVKAIPGDPARIQLEKADDGPFTSLKDNIIFAADSGDNYKQKEYEIEISRTGK